MKPATDMAKTATVLERVEHLLFGHGSVVEPRITESGKSAYLVRFDASDTDRLILADSLKPSKSSVPDEPPKKKIRKKAAAAPVKKTRARKIASTDEPISDKLLVPELDEALLRPPDGVLEEYEED
jgi:hypothetical protein